MQWDILPAVTIIIAQTRQESMKIYCKFCHWAAKLAPSKLCILHNQLWKLNSVQSSVAK